MARRVVGGDQLAGVDQDVARVVLAHQFLLLLADLDQLEDVEAAGAAHRLGDLAGLHAGDLVREGVRHLVVLAPAEVAALERLLAIGKADRGRGEVEAAVDLLHDHLGLLARGLDLRRAGAIGHADEDVRQPHLAALEALAREQDIDLGIGDVDAALHEALAQALHQELVAHGVAELGVAEAVALERGAQLVEADVVLLREPHHRLVELGVVDPDAGLLRARELQPDRDQPLEHLALDHLARRQLPGAPGVLREDVADRAVEFALQDDVLVHHRDDAVDGIGRERLRPRALGGAERGEGRGR